MDEEERKSKLEAGKARLLKFQKKKAKGSKKKKAAEQSSSGKSADDFGALGTPASVTEDSLSVATPSYGADTGQHTPGNVSPLPFDSEVSVAAGAREILAQQTDDFEDLLQEAEPSLVSGLSHRSLSPSRGTHELMTEGTTDLGGMAENETPDTCDRLWVNQLNELQSENDELRLSQLRLVEGKDREISKLREQVEFLRSQRDSAQDQGMQIARQRLQLLESELAEKTSQLELLETQLDELGQQNKALVEQKATVGTTGAGRLQQALADCQQRLREAQEELTQSYETNKTLQANWGEQRSALELAYSQQVQQLQAAYQSNQEQLKQAYESQLQQYQTKLLTAESLEIEVTRVNSELAQLKSEMATKLSEKEREMSQRYEQELADSKMELDELRVRLQDDNPAAAVQQSKLEALQLRHVAEVQELIVKHNGDLEEAENKWKEKLEKEKMELKAQLDIVYAQQMEQYKSMVEQNVNKKVQGLCADFQQKFGDLQSENAQCKEQLMAQTDTNNRLIEQNKTLSISVQEMSSEYAEMEEKLQQTVEQLKDLETEREELKLQVSEHLEEIKDLSQLRSNYEMLEEDRMKDSDCMKSLEDQLQDVSHQKEKLQRELNEVKSAFEMECAKSRRIPVLEDEVATLKRDKDDAMNQSMLVRQESIGQIKSLKEQHSREIEHLRQSMEEQEQDHIEMKRREIEEQRHADLEQMKEEYEVKMEQMLTAKEAEIQRKFIEQMQEVRNELEHQHSKNIESWKQRCDTVEHQAASLQNALQQERRRAEESQSPNQKSDLRRLQVDCEELEKARELLLKQNEWQKRQNESLQQDMAALSRSNEKLEGEKRDLCRQLQVKEEESKEHARHRADLEGERGHDEVRLSMNDKIKQIEAEKLRLHEQLSTQRDVTRKIEGELDEVRQILSEEKAGYDQHIGQLRKQLMEKREDDEQQRNSIELELRAEWDESQKQKDIKLNALERENNALQQLVSDTQVQLKSSEEVVEQFKSDLADTEAVRARLEHETEEQKKELGDLRDELLTHTQVSEELQRSFGRELISLKQQRDSLQTQLESHQVESQTYASVVFEKERLEKALNDYRGQLSVRQKERDSLEQDLAREKAALELQLIEKEKLEQLINAKIALEKQLGNQKVLLESELQAIERELQTKNKEIESEKAAFGKALDEKEHSVQSIRETMRRQEEEASRRENSMKSHHQLELTELGRTLDDQHQQHLSQVEKNFEAQRVANIEAVEQDWRQLHEQQMDELERNHQHNVEEIVSEHQRKMDELRAELNSHVTAREKSIREEFDQRRMQEITTVKEVHERDTARLIEEKLLKQAAKHQREIEQMKAEAEKEFMKKLEDVRTELAHAHQAEIDILTEGYSDDQRQQLQLLREQMQQEHHRQLTEATEQRQVEWEKREEKLRIQYKRERESISQQEKLQWERTLDEVKKRHSEEISRLEVSLRDMADEHRRQLEQLRLKHEEEQTGMSQLLKEQQSEVFEELKKSLEKRHHEDLEFRISQMKQECERETEAMRMKLNDEHGEEVCNLRRECEEQKHLAIEELQTEMENKMLKEIKSLQEIHLQDMEAQQERHEEELRQKTEEFCELLREEKEKLVTAQLQYESQKMQAVEEITSEVNQLQTQLFELEKNHKLEKEDIKRLHADEIIQIEERCTEKIARLHTSMESRIADEKSKHIDELQESVSEVEARYQHLKLSQGTDKLQLESEFEEAKMMLMKQHSNELSALEMRLRERSQVQLDEMRSRLTDEHRQTIQEMEDRFEKEVEELRVSRDEEWKRLKVEMEKQHEQTVEERLDEMTQSHQYDLVSLREQAQEEKQKVIDETNDHVAATLSQLTMSHSLEIEQLKSRHSCEIEGMQTALQAQFDSRLALLETELRQKNENSIEQLELDLKGIRQRLSDTEICLHNETEEKAQIKEQFDEIVSKMERENDVLKARLEEQKGILKSEHELKLQESVEMMREAEESAYQKLHKQHEVETQRLFLEQKNELSSRHMEKFKVMTDQLVKEQEEELEKVRLECERQKLEELNNVRLEGERERLAELEKVRIEFEREKEEALQEQQRGEDIKLQQMKHNVTQQFQEEKQALEAELRCQFEEERLALFEANENLAAELDSQAIEFEQQKRIEIDTLKQKLEENHVQDIASIREQWDRETQQLVSKTTFELHSQYREQIDKLLTEFERDLQQARAETDDKYQQRLSRLQEEREQAELSKIANVEEKMKAEISLLQNKIQEKQTELELMRSRSAEEKAELELSKQRELSVVENELRSQLREEQKQLDVALDEKQKLEHQIQTMTKLSQAEKQQQTVKLEGSISRIGELESDVTDLKRQLVDARRELEENTEYYEKRLMEKERERETYVNHAILVEEDNNSLNNSSERLRAANQQLIDTLSHQVAVTLELEQMINNCMTSLLAHEGFPASGAHVDALHLNDSSEAGESLPDDSVCGLDESLPSQPATVAAAAAVSGTQTSPSTEANNSRKGLYSFAASGQTDEGVCDNSRLSLSAISDTFLVSTVTEADRTLLDSTLAEPISEITHVTDIRVNEAAGVVGRLQAAVKRLIDFITEVGVKLEDLTKRVTRESEERAAVVASHEQELTELMEENAKLLDEIKAHQDDHTDANMELDEMRAEVQRLVAENENLSNLCQQTEHDRSVAEEERVQAQSHLRQVEEVRGQLISEMECLVEKSKMVELSQQQLDEERLSLRNKVAKLEKELNAVKQQNEVLCNRLTLMEKDEHERESPSDRLHMEHELEEKELLISQLQQSETELTGNIEQLSVRCEKECHAARSVQSKLDEIKAYAAQLEVEKASLEKKLADLQTEDYGQLRSELQRLQQQFDCVGMTIAALEQDKKQLEQQLVVKEEQLQKLLTQKDESVVKENDQTTQTELEVQELRVQLRNTERDRDEAYKLLEVQKSGKMSFEEVVGLVKIHSLTPPVSSTDDQDVSEEGVSKEMEQWREQSPWQEKFKLKEENSQLKLEIERQQNQLSQMSAAFSRLEFQQPRQLKLLQLQVLAKGVGVLRERQRWQREVMKFKKLQQPVVEAMLESKQLDETIEKGLKEAIANLEGERIKAQRPVPVDVVESVDENLDAKDRDVDEPSEEQQQQIQVMVSDYEKQIRERDELMRDLEAEKTILSNELEQTQTELQELKSQLVNRVKRQLVEPIQDFPIDVTSENSRLKDQLETVEEQLVVTQQQLALKEKEVMELERRERELKEQAKEKQHVTDGLSATVDRLNLVLDEKNCLVSEKEEHLRVWASREIVYQRQIALLTDKQVAPVLVKTDVGVMTEWSDDGEKTRMGEQLTELERLLGEARLRAKEMEQRVTELVEKCTLSELRAEQMESRIKVALAERDATICEKQQKSDEEVRQSQAIPEESEAVKVQMEGLHSKLSVAEERLVEQENEHNEEVEALKANLAEKSRIIAQLHSRVKQLISAVERRSVELRHAEQQVSDLKMRTETLEQRLLSVTRESSSSQTDQDVVQDEAYESDGMLERCRKQVSRCERLDGYLVELLSLANWSGAGDAVGSEQEQSEEIGHALERLHATAVDLLGLSEAQRDRMKADQSSLGNEISQVYKLLQTVRSEAYTHTAQVLRDIQATWQRSRSNLSEDGQAVVEAVQKALQVDRSHSLQSVAEMAAAVDAMRDTLTNTPDHIDSKAEQRMGAFQSQLRDQQIATEAVRSALNEEQLKCEALERDCREKEKMLNEVRKELEAKQSTLEAMQSALREEKDRCDHWQREVTSEQERLHDVSVALQRECEANGQLTALLATERSMKTTAEADLQFQKAETDQTTAKLGEANELVKRLRKKLHEVKRESDKKLSDSNGTIERMTHEIKELTRTKGELERRSCQQESELGETRERVNELMEDLEKRRKNIRRLEAELQEIKDTVTEMKRLEKQHCVDREEERKAEVARELERDAERERERLNEEERERERVMERTRERQRQVEREKEVEREEQRHAEKQAEAQLRQQEKLEWLKREAELSQKLTDIEHRFAKKSSPVADEATRRVLLDMRGTIQKLTKEKAELRQTLLTLEEAVDLYRRKENERVGVAMDEREISWERNKAELELAVKTKEEDRKRWKEEATNSYKEARCYYDFFIRSEGFRKSLAFQKRFLLVRLGGFQDCERAALTLLSDMGAVGDPRRGQLSQHPGFRLRKAIFAVLAVVRLRLLAGKWSHFGYPESKVVLRLHPVYRPGRGRRLTEDVSQLRTELTNVDTALFSHDSRTLKSNRSDHVPRSRHHPVLFQAPERGIQDSLSSSSTTSVTTGTLKPVTGTSRSDSTSKPLNTWSSERQDRVGLQQRQHSTIQSDPSLEAYIQRLDDLRDRISSRTKGHGNQYY